MSQLRSATLVALGLSLPFAAWGTSASLNSDPAYLETQPATQIGLDALPDAAPPSCGLTSPEDAADEIDAHPAACCWFFHMGRWYCVSC